MLFGQKLTKHPSLRWVQEGLGLVDQNDRMRSSYYRERHTDEGTESVALLIN